MASMQDDFARKLRHQQPARVDYSREGWVDPRVAEPCRCDEPAAIGDEPCDRCCGKPGAA